MKKTKKKLINIKGIIIGIIIFFLFYYSSFLQLIPIKLFNLNLKKITMTQQVILTTFSDIVLILILFIIFRKQLINEWKIFKKNTLENIDTGVKYWLIGLAVMMISNIIITIFFKMGQAANEQAVQQMITSLPWLMVITAGVLAPFIEEVVFRKCFKNAFLNKWLFIGLSGLVFGALPVITTMTSPLDLLYIIPYGALGISFAAMYQKTNTIYTSIAMHMFHNTSLVLLSILV